MKKKQSSLWDEPKPEQIPQTPRIVPGPSVESMQARCAKIGMNWDTLLVNVLHNLLRDEEITPQQRAELNTVLVGLEATQLPTGKKKGGKR